MILVISPKNVYASKRLKAEAGRLKTTLEILDASDLVDRDFKLDLEKYTTLYVRNPFFGNSAEHLPRIINLAKKFKAAGKKVVDKVIADGDLAKGKGVDYERLAAAGLLVPRTTQFSAKDVSAFGGKIQNPKSKIQNPFILKWIYGFKGKHTFLVQNQTELNVLLKKYPAKELLAQEFIAAEYEYKIITVGYKALPVILKFAIHPLTNRPDFEKYFVIMTSPLDKKSQPRIEGLINLAERSSKVLKRELAKVDILQKGDKFYVLEVNRFPGLDSFEQLTKYNVAKDFLLYLQDLRTEPISRHFSEDFARRTKCTTSKTAGK